MRRRAEGKKRKHTHSWAAVMVERTARVRRIARKSQLFLILAPQRAKVGSSFDQRDPAAIQQENANHTRARKKRKEKK